MAGKGNIKVLLAQFPLETHSREIISIASMLEHHGMEVVLMGNALPEDTIERAVEESVDVIGICTFGGGEVVLGDILIKCAKKRGIRERISFIIGGIINPDNVTRLKKVGFDATFLTATKDSGTPEEIISCIENACITKAMPATGKTVSKKAPAKKAVVKNALATKKVIAKKAPTKKAVAKKAPTKKK
jgi:methylmalonyl-CoA mutase cobalamin-binding domain/chain